MVWKQPVKKESEIEDADLQGGPRYLEVFEN